jgi:hypothetical protein
MKTTERITAPTVAKMEANALQSLASEKKLFNLVIALTSNFPELDSLENVTAALISLRLGYGWGVYERKQIDQLMILKPHAKPEVIDALAILKDGARSTVSLKDELSRYTESQALSKIEKTAPRTAKTETIKALVEKPVLRYENPTLSTDAEGNKIVEVVVDLSQHTPNEPVSFTIAARKPTPTERDKAASELVGLIGRESNGNNTTLRLKLDKTTGDIFTIYISARQGAAAPVSTKLESTQLQTKKTTQPSVSEQGQVAVAAK